MIGRCNLHCSKMKIEDHVENKRSDEIKEILEILSRKLAHTMSPRKKITRKYIFSSSTSQLDQPPDNLKSKTHLLVSSFPRNKKKGFLLNNSIMQPYIIHTKKIGEKIWNINLMILMNMLMMLTMKNSIIESNN
jgi:hypothetical protein